MAPTRRVGGDCALALSTLNRIPDEISGAVGSAWRVEASCSGASQPSMNEADRPGGRSQETRSRPSHQSGCPQARWWSVRFIYPFRGGYRPPGLAVVKVRQTWRSTTLRFPQDQAVGPAGDAFLPRRLAGVETVLVGCAGQVRWCGAVGAPWLGPSLLGRCPVGQAVCERSQSAHAECPSGGWHEVQVV